MSGPMDNKDMIQSVAKKKSSFFAPKLKALEK
jgi:hypothetical protein